MSKNTSTVMKSYMHRDGSSAKTVPNYCLSRSTPLHPVHEKLLAETINEMGGKARMMGAPEVLMLNQNIIRAMGGKKSLDIGVFTGASTLTAALALPEDGKVVACDINEAFMDKAKTYWKEAGIEGKVDARVAPATETLDKLIENEEAGTYDFAFIDADKPNYSAYYEKCLVLLRRGGTIVFDNTLWSGRVIDSSDQSVDVVAIRALNDKVAADWERTNAVMLNVGDGITMCVKK